MGYRAPHNLLITTRIYTVVFKQQCNMNFVWKCVYIAGTAETSLDLSVATTGAIGGLPAFLTAKYICVRRSAKAIKCHTQNSARFIMLQ